MTEPGDPPAANGTPPKRQRMPYRPIAIGVAAGLLAVVAIVATAPFWAGALPWGAPPAREAAPAAPRNPPAAPRNAPTAAPAQPAASPPSSTPAASAALAALDRRVGALEARPPASEAEIAELRRQIATLSAAAADLATRVAAIDQAGRSGAARASADAALVVTLIEIRGAIAAGRPFAPEYARLVALAAARPAIAAAAAPLAASAKSGVASRALLAERLRALAGAIAAPLAPEVAPADKGGAKGGWVQAVLSQLGGVVTIRRVGEAGANPPGRAPLEAVVAAERALAEGDLGGAVASLDRLAGPPVEAALPWLRLAKERLAATAALDRLEAAAAGELGAPAKAAPGTGPAR